MCVCGRVHFDGSEGHERTNRRRTQSLCVLGNLCEFRLMEKKKKTLKNNVQQNGCSSATSTTAQGFVTVERIMESVEWGCVKMGLKLPDVDQLAAALLKITQLINVYV